MNEQTTYGWTPCVKLMTTHWLGLVDQLEELLKTFAEIK